MRASERPETETKVLFVIISDGIVLLLALAVRISFNSNQYDFDKESRNIISPENSAIFAKIMPGRYNIIQSGSLYYNYINAVFARSLIYL